MSDEIREQIERMRTVYLAAHHDQIECIAAAADTIESLLAENERLKRDVANRDAGIANAVLRIEQLERVLDEAKRVNYYRKRIQDGHGIGSQLGLDQAGDDLTAAIAAAEGE